MPFCNSIVLINCHTLIGSKFEFELDAFAHIRTRNVVSVKQQNDRSQETGDTMH